MVFKMKGFTAFTKQTDKDITPETKTFVSDMIPQAELNKMDLDDLPLNIVVSTPSNKTSTGFSNFN